MTETLVFSLALLLFALFLVYTHLRGWQEAQAADLDEPELDFQWRQFRRRMQASAMLAIAGLVLPLYSLIHTPILMTIFVLGLFLLVLWIMALAGADYLASRHRLRQLEDDERIERARLNVQLRRRQQLESGGGNGAAEGD